MKRPGFSIIEIIVAMGLVVVGFFTFFSVFTTGSHHSVQTRNRAVANLLGQSYLEEFKAHTYGDPAPPHWAQPDDRPLKLIVAGREQQYKFHKVITYANGSFVDATKTENFDKVKLTITWREQTGNAQTDGAVTGTDDNKMLEVEVPVWR